jgi:hypothetical protein
MKEANIPWCADAQYPGLRQFLCGTIVMKSDAQHHEIEAAMRDHMAGFLPPGFAVLRMRRGALFFTGSDE